MTAKTRPVARLRAVSPPKTHRRGQERSPCNLDISFRKLDSRSNYFWMARVWDISRTGISVQLKEEIAAGTVLEIEILKGRAVARMLLARVVHATAHPGGAWVIGCDLERPLGEEELEALL